MTANPFQIEIDAAVSAASAALKEAEAAPPDRRDRLLDEFERLNAVASDLIRLGLEWLETRLRTVVGDIEAMASREAQRQSRIAGRLKDLAGRLRTEVGSEATATGAGALVTSSLPTAPPAAAPVTVVVARSVDPEKCDVDLMKLHPAMREKVQQLQRDLATQGVPMRLFEAYREPERQRVLFGKGRTAPGNIVTNADAWQSYHQYGLAIDMVIDAPGLGLWDDSPAGMAIWKDYHAIAARLGLERLSFETPHVQLAGLSHQALLNGDYPPGGDSAWADNLTSAIERWREPDKPPAPDLLQRPAMRVASAITVDRSSLPRKPTLDWHKLFGGQEWRVDDHGVYLRSVNGGMTPLRTPGRPLTATSILDLFGQAIVDASIRFRVAPELLVMTIATETAAFRNSGFTGPETFRWEPHIADYSAGPMQVLSGTASDVNSTESLGFLGQDFPKLATKPSKPPANLALYKHEVALPIGAALIARNRRSQGTGDDPILVAAAYNAGGVRSSNGNFWRIASHGNHLDRAAEWYGDACFVCAEFLR